MTPIASRSLWATIADAPSFRAPSAAAPPWLTFGVNGPIRRAVVPAPSAASFRAAQRVAAIQELRGPAR